MTATRAAWLLPLFSLGVQFPEDSTLSRISVSGGAGNYSFITRDCSGNAIGGTEVPFASGSASYEYQVSEMFWIGARLESFKRKKSRTLDQVAVYNDRNEDYDYLTVDRSAGTLLTSFITLESPNAALSVGVVHPFKKFTLGNMSYERNQLCGRLRLGWLDRYHIEGSYGFNTPLVAGGGTVDLGLGIPIDKEGGRVWIGVDAVPYEASGLLVKLNAPIGRGFFLTGSGRFASAGGITHEQAFSFGVTYQWSH